MKTRFVRSLAAAIASLAATALVSAATNIFERAYSLEGVSRVRVENVNGGINVRTWDRNYVRVTATKTGSPASLEHTIIRATQPAGEIRIETVSTRRHHLFFFMFSSERLARVEFELLLPAATPIKVETVNGSISIGGRRGEIRAETVNGGIDMRGVDAEVHAETVNGRIFVSQQDSRDTHLETVNGSIEAEFPSDASLRYKLETLNGSMEVGERRSHAHALGIKSFEGEINGGRVPFKASSVNGSIRVRLEGGAAPKTGTIPTADGRNSM
jgi:Putative adhesin